MEKIDTFLHDLKSNPESVSFSDTINLIDRIYHFTPTTFTNGEIKNTINENNGSCKILAFGKLNKLTAQETLYLFGDFYRKDVLENPTGTDHQNIRNFISHGWEKVYFDTNPLSEK